MKKTFLIVLMATHVFGCFAQNGEKGLKDAYKDYFKIGVAVNRRNLDRSNEMELVKANFNSVTCE
ncbi:MAG: endo-1,4-beta-xylanase, partial [Bacteroidaceae bacterium]|nr:endo-1,4-beta-xylanase [Bacteroidaceae bacterium]